MAFDSYRDFVNALDQAGELKRISQPVATELEITELADREMKSPDGGKALLIEKPTVNGVVSPFPVAINTLGSHKRIGPEHGRGNGGPGCRRTWRLDEGQTADFGARDNEVAFSRPGSPPRETESREGWAVQGSRSLG